MLIGRKEEQKILKEALNKDESQFIAVYGRRRVGKTYLVRETFQGQFTFSAAGIYKGSYEDELNAFSASLKDYGLIRFKKPGNWLDAFQLLKSVIESSPRKKKVIFLDEIS